MKIRNLILPAVLLLFSLYSCEVEEPFSKRSEIEEGLPVKVLVPFRTQPGVVITRADQGAELENRVNNAYLIVFDEVGNKIGRKFCTEGNGMEPKTNSTGTLEINTISQNRAYIVGIANLNDGTVGTAYDITPDMLEQITTYDQLCSLQVKLSERGVQRGSTFVMTGMVIDEEGNNIIQIPGSENGTSTLSGCELRFERTDAKIEFIVKTEPANNSWKNFSFQPNSWRVHKVPAQVLVLKDENGGDADGEGTEYFSSREVNFEVINRDAATASYTGGSFVFYMPENKKQPRAVIPDNPNKDAAYALRDKQDKNTPAEGDDTVSGQTEINGEFTYANENSTYVEITGTLSYEYVGQQDNNTYYVEADTRYIVHLGYASGNPNDYDTDRNCNYTYTVTVRGINDIEVEVTADPQGPGEVRPGAEGDVIYSRVGVYEFDAHYDRRLIHIPLDQIPAVEGGVTWGVRTPFSNGIYELNSNNTEGIEDYKWVKFAINSDYGVYGNLYVKYPGDQNYDDPEITDGTDDLPPGSDYGYSGNYTEARLLDVKQFVERINKMKADGKTGTVDVTVFIDEYVYFRNPQSYKEDLSLWRYSVDQPDRMMYIFIVPGDSKYSPDGESLVINSVLTFRQKSLRTVYDVDHKDLETDPDPTDNYQGLWGLESVMEAADKTNGGRLETGGNAIQNGDSRSNGRLNTLRCILGTGYNRTLHWSDVLNTNDHYSLNPGYNNALYACLMRNRDLNGDNIIDPEEIRWYLASVNQLVDLYIGEYALDTEARLYPAESADRPGAQGICWHYTTSTWNNGNPEVLWAEEGASLGSYGASQSSNGHLYAYRCVRNLGIEITGNNVDYEREPLPLFTVTPYSEGYLIDATRLNPNSRRENFETGYLPAHNDLSISNLPYAKFQVRGADDDYPAPSGTYSNRNLDFTNDATWEQCLQYEDEGSLQGYRMPNQRELLIMLNYLPDKAWKTYSVKSLLGRTAYSKAMYMCKTRFSRANEGHFAENGTDIRTTFRMNAQNKSMGVVNDVNSDKGYIRAVKDKDVRQ